MNTRKKMEEGLESGEVDELKFKKELLDVEIPKINKDCDALSKAISEEIFEKVDTNMDEAC